MSDVLLEEAIELLDTIETAVGMIMAVKGERQQSEDTGYPKQARDIINRARKEAAA